MNAIRGSLASRQPREPLNDDEIRSWATWAWHEHGILLVNPAKLLRPLDRDAARLLGERVYGPRRPRQNEATRQYGPQGGRDA